MARGLAKLQCYWVNKKSGARFISLRFRFWNHCRLLVNNLRQFFVVLVAIAMRGADRCGNGWNVLARLGRWRGFEIERCLGQHNLARVLRLD